MAAVEKDQAKTEEASAKGKEGGAEDFRGNLVKVAVKFLNNPRVINNPLHKKKVFLKKKGFTDAEVAESIRQSELTKPTTSSIPSLPPPLPPRPPSHPSPFTTHTPSHLPSRTWRDYAVIVAVVGGVGYAIYRLITHYVVPWLNARIEQSARLEEISSSMRELQTNIDTTISGLNETTKNIQNVLSEQQENIQLIGTQVTALQASTPGSGLAVKEIRDEVASLKGLLLNRHQFSTPTTTHSHSVMGIPSWQRTAQTEHKADAAENKEGEGEEEEGEGEREEGEGEGEEGEGEEGVEGEGEEGEGEGEGEEGEGEGEEGEGEGEEGREGEGKGQGEEGSETVSQTTELK